MCIYISTYTHAPGKVQHQLPVDATAAATQLRDTLLLGGGDERRGGGEAGRSAERRARDPAPRVCERGCTQLGLMGIGSYGGYEASQRLTPLCLGTCGRPFIGEGFIGSMRQVGHEADRHLGRMG